MPAMTIDDAEYVLPLRWSDDRRLPEFVLYLERLVEWIPVTVVDGSSDELFNSHSRSFPPAVRHERPEPWPGRNGKVGGVMTGVIRARGDRLVIADDDVRYTRGSLQRVIGLLDGAEIVRPQNYFDPLPWHSRWDTARSLLNRSVGSDYPGTLGLRRSALLSTGGYDGDVLFENLELIRTVRAGGGREKRADDVFVRRIPPTVRQFFGQRVRQAYDDFAQPPRLVAELAILPALVLVVRRPWLLAAASVGLIALAESGRLRGGGRLVFPPTSSLWAPLWAFERSICVWIAAALRLTGGVRYSNGWLSRAANSMRVLRQRASSNEGKAV